MKFVRGAWHRTKGMWMVDEDEGYGYHPRVSSDYTLVAVVGNAQFDEHERHLADATLIAMAPDLYDALMDCRDAMHEDNSASGWLEIIQRADTVLARARGEEALKKD